jgi:IS30 family transposase
MNRELRDIVASKLVLDWSPEQISGWLKTHYPDDGSMRAVGRTAAMTGNLPTHRGNGSS